MKLIHLKSTRVGIIKSKEKYDLDMLRPAAIIIRKTGKNTFKVIKDKYGELDDNK